MRALLLSRPTDARSPAFPVPANAARLPTPGPFHPRPAASQRSDGFAALWTSLLALCPMLAALAVIVVALAGHGA